MNHCLTKSHGKENSLGAFSRHHCGCLAHPFHPGDVYKVTKINNKEAACCNNLWKDSVAHGNFSKRKARFVKVRLLSWQQLVIKALKLLHRPLLQRRRNY